MEVQEGLSRPTYVSIYMCMHYHSVGNTKLTEQVILLFLSFIPSSGNIKIRGIYSYINQDYCLTTKAILM